MSTKLPHHQVYGRISRSRINGVGVKAICPIKKGIYIFFGDDDELIWITRDKISHLSKELKKLYIDFAILKNGRFGCPKNFNLLTPAWYLNHSKHPNVGCDSKYNFFALRNIKKGEELTVDYDTYSQKI
jgi:SET domain